VVRAHGVLFFDVLLAFVLGLVEENVDGWCLVIRGIEDVSVGVISLVAVSRCSVVVLVACRNHFVPNHRSYVLESPVAFINRRPEPYLPCHRAVDERPSRCLCYSSCVQSLLAKPPTSLDAIVLSSSVIRSCCCKLVHAATSSKAKHTSIVTTPDCFSPWDTHRSTRKLYILSKAGQLLRPRRIQVSADLPCTVAALSFAFIMNQASRPGASIHTVILVYRRRTCLAIVPSVEVHRRAPSCHHRAINNVTSVSYSTLSLSGRRPSVLA
jgi:hypothetical protein